MAKDKQKKQKGDEAAAAAPAVLARSTVGPSRRLDAPASSKARSSAGVIPPSGPTTRTTSSASRPTASDVSGVVASSDRTTAADTRAIGTRGGEHET